MSVDLAETTHYSSSTVQADTHASRLIFAGGVFIFAMADHAAALRAVAHAVADRMLLSIKQRARREIRQVLRLARKYAVQRRLEALSAFEIDFVGPTFEGLEWVGTEPPRVDMPKPAFEGPIVRTGSATITTEFA